VLQGFKKEFADIELDGDYCPLKTTASFKRSVYSRTFRYGNRIQFMLSRQVHPAIFANIATEFPETQRIEVGQPNVVASCAPNPVSLVTLASKSMFESLSAVSSREEFGAAFGSGTVQGGCSYDKPGDATDQCGVGPKCFCNINDGKFGPEAAWKPAFSSLLSKGSNKFVGIRFAGLKRIHGFRISSQAEPRGFTVQSTELKTGTDPAGTYFIAVNILGDLLTNFFHNSSGSGVPTTTPMKVDAQVWRLGEAIWTGNLSIDKNVDNMVKPSNYRADVDYMRGYLIAANSTTTPPILFQVGDTVHIAKFMTNPIGLANSNVADHYGWMANSEDLKNFSQIKEQVQGLDKVRAKAFRDGKQFWGGDLKLTIPNEKIDLCPTCDIFGEPFVGNGQNDGDKEKIFKYGDVILLTEGGAMKEVDQAELTRGTFEVQYTTIQNPTFTTEDENWCSAGMANVTKGGFNYQHFEGGPLNARGVRILLSNPSAQLDELVVYGLGVIKEYGPWGEEIKESTKA
jgi:hypothetical protein